MPIILHRDSEKLRFSPREDFYSKFFCDLLPPSSLPSIPFPKYNREFHYSRLKILQWFLATHRHTGPIWSSTILFSLIFQHPSHTLCYSPQTLWKGGHSLCICILYCLSHIPPHLSGWFLPLIWEPLNSSLQPWLGTFSHSCHYLITCLLPPTDYEPLQWTNTGA